MTWVKRPTKTKVFEYKRKIGSFHPVRQRARSDIAAIYKRIHYEIQKLLKPKGSECNRMEINRYEQLQAGNESDHSDGEASGNIRD